MVLYFFSYCCGLAAGSRIADGVLTMISRFSEYKDSEAKENDLRSEQFFFSLAS